MEGLTSSDQQRGNVDGKHEKGLGDVRGTQAGPGLTSSDGSSSKAGRDVFVVPSYSLLVPFFLVSSAWAGWLAGGALGGFSTRDHALPTPGWRSRWLRLERVKAAGLGWAAAGLED